MISNNKTLLVSLAVLIVALFSLLAVDAFAMKTVATGGEVGKPDSKQFQVACGSGYIVWVHMKLVNGDYEIRFKIQKFHNQRKLYETDWTDPVVVGPGSDAHFDLDPEDGSGNNINVGPADGTDEGSESSWGESFSTGSGTGSVY